MKKDIQIPIAEDVFVVAIHQWDEEKLNKDWWVYLINNQKQALEATILVSKGYGDGLKTSTIRHGFGTLEPKSATKVELLQEEVFKLSNEFFLTFFKDGKLFEKKFVFEPYQLSEENIADIPLVDEKGILAK
ncbi:hypothetical protein I215_08922 [Galbibacter marinus]|uniref:Phenylalanyl-tRNA synthetase subunit alpha n=1 Tax=Galbibacter marinus TaxID=555500 RepID=K2PRE3_9FLAO|nr:hypothetical protein [Galbibacter marinus]EKF55140.1 hypothetical protein I215_08922 [Galbibacter marinus]